MRLVPHWPTALEQLICCLRFTRRDPARQIWGSRPPTEDTSELSRGTAALAAERVRADRTVAVDDVRYANGEHPRLIRALDDEWIRTSIAAYGGWNTAGNSTGSALAAGFAVVGCDSDEARARQRAFLVRKVPGPKDCRGRPLPTQRATRDPTGGERLRVERPDPGGDPCRRTENRRRSELLDALVPVPGAVDRRQRRLPWHYAFTVDLNLAKEDTVINP